MTESRYRWFVAMARVAQADGDPDEAVNLLDRAEQLYRPGFFLRRTTHRGHEDPDLDRARQAGGRR